jgi:branched-chain amino acid aminotransferase
MHDFPYGAAYVDDQFMPIAEAKISIFDWGFLHSDATYDLEAYDRGGETAVLVDTQGNLIEGPGFNIFAAKGRTITTPARGVLEGITRRTTIELATKYGYEVLQRNLPAAEARAAEEVFITSTAGGIMPITKIDGGTISSGIPGPVTQELQDRYWTLHEDPHFTYKIDYD